MRPKRRRRKTRARAAFLVLLTLALVFGCGVYTYAANSAGGETRKPPALADPAAQAAPTPAAMFTNRRGESGAIDIQSAGDGYILARCETGRRAKLILEKGGEAAREYLPADGEWHAYPLVFGDGTYDARIVLEEAETYYQSQVELVFDARVEDPLRRFLIPNHFVPYREGDAVVAFARAFYAETDSDVELAERAFEWMVQMLRYDTDLAYDENGARITGYYLPDPDRILEEKSGICSDYASLFAATLRINGVPCQLVYGERTVNGTVKPHAWNLVWLPDEDGTYRWWRFDATYNIKPPLYTARYADGAGASGHSSYSAPMEIH